MLKRYYPCCSAQTRYSCTHHERSDSRTSVKLCPISWPLCTWTKQPLSSSVPRGWSVCWSLAGVTCESRSCCVCGTTLTRCWWGLLVQIRGSCLSSAHDPVISSSPSIFPLLSSVSPSEVVKPPHVINNQEESLSRVCGLNHFGFFYITFALKKSIGKKEEELKSYLTSII